jgi:uncharacterized metal-binding protein
MGGDNSTQRLLVIPCSGVGKVHGLISREVAYRVVDALLPDRADTVCLALLVTADPDARRRIQQNPCVTVDGCPKLCAKKNVELCGGKVAGSIRVYDAMKRHRGGDFGSATALNAEGWGVVDEIAAEIAQAVQHPTAS